MEQTSHLFCGIKFRYDMDKGRLNKIVSKMLETLLEGITIRDYMNKSKELEVDNFLESVLGFEIINDFY